MAKIGRPKKKESEKVKFKLIAIYPHTKDKLDLKSQQLGITKVEALDKAIDKL